MTPTLQRNPAAGPTNGIPLRPLQAGYCAAVAPPDWQFTNTDPMGTILELHNGTFAAFHNILGIDDMTMQQMTQPMPFGDTYVQEFESAIFHVLAMYRVYPMPTGGVMIDLWIG